MNGNAIHGYSPNGLAGYFNGKSYFNGNVGIGVNISGAQLSIQGLNTEDGTVWLTSPKGSNLSHIHYGATGDWYIRSASATGRVVMQDLGGNVGIGLSNPLYALDVNGNIHCRYILTDSDARYKKNINLLENPLGTILNMRGVSYDWKRDDFKEMNFGAGRQIGFIAQELEKVLPELVHTDSKGYKSVNYSHVVPVLVEAVKAQQGQINRLSNAEKRATDAEKKNIALDSRVSRLEKLLEALADAKANQK